MTRRGPKLQTANNAPGNVKGFIRHESLTPTSALTPEALAEFDRLIAVLDARGTLDRVDLAVVTNAARVKALLDRAEADVKDNLDPIRLKAMTTLLAQHRGLLRELGLTLQPSRSLIRTNAQAGPGYWSRLLPTEGLVKYADNGGFDVKG
jgi:hypothetical protein